MISAPFSACSVPSSASKYRVVSPSSSSPSSASEGVHADSVAESSVASYTPSQSVFLPHAWGRTSIISPQSPCRHHRRSFASAASCFHLSVPSLLASSRVTQSPRPRDKEEGCKWGCCIRKKAKVRFDCPAVQTARAPISWTIEL